MSKNVLGVYLSDYKIVCAEVKVGRPPKTEKVAAWPIPKGSITFGSINNLDKVAESLIGVLDKLEASTYNAVLNIPTNLVGIKTIPHEEGYSKITEDQIAWEMSLHMNEPVENLVTSCFQTPYGLVMSASLNRYLIERGKVLEKAGLFVESIDPQPIADFNLMTVSSAARQKLSLAVVNVEKYYSHVIIFDKGKFFFGTNFFVSSDMLGKNESTKLNDEIAESIKLSIGAYILMEPSFQANGIVYFGFPISEAAKQGISERLNIKEIKPKDIFPKGIMSVKQKTGLTISEVLPVIGLAMQVYA